MKLNDILSRIPLNLPRRAGRPQGSLNTPTFDPENRTEVISLPDYLEHRQDLISDRASQNSQELIANLVKSDPDASSALNSYLTVANVEPYILVYDVDNVVDREGYKLVNQILELLTTRRDYSRGFQMKKSIRQLCEELRYMLLVRGGIGVEAVFDRNLAMTELRNIDMGSIQFQEPEPNRLVPYQDQGSGDPIPMDIPTFFVGWYRKSPLDMYGTSAFVSAINTMAARQQVINDLYRLMQLTGFPRIKVKVLEEMLHKMAPPDVRSDQKALAQWLNARRAEIAGQFQNIRADQPMVHMDSTDVSILNEKNPAASLDITNVIEVLNANNQAGLRTMATILGRGESGVNTATVEANLFAMNASSLNAPISEVLSSALTLALRMNGSESRVVVRFPDVDLRSELELEPQLQLRSNRLRQDLSDGLISDDEYHLMVYRRLRPDNVPELSGTGFLNSKMEVDVERISPNDDPMGRSVSRASDRQARSNSNSTTRTRNQ